MTAASGRPRTVGGEVKPPTQIFDEVVPKWDTMYQVEVNIS